MIYYCTSCDNTRNFIDVAVHVKPEAGPPIEYTLARCETCADAALFYREDMGDGFEGDNYYRLWPPHERHIGFLLPDIVRQSYDEAVKCENAKAHLAAAVMVRRALEAVTKEYEPTARTLHSGMKALLESGIISKELSDWGDQLRVIGNLGAHATSEKIDAQDVAEAIDFLQAMLEILYDLRPRFEKMRLRRAANAKGTPASQAPPTQSV
ncbi:MAG TPA: DUF4145 domain-containing protein [Bryobacteraceae bacterium]|nr:DUF4145 domain-containing protein [Bryobacteraceae bacterium]